MSELSGAVSWAVVYIVIGVGGFVGMVVWWIAMQVRTLEKELIKSLGEARGLIVTETRIVATKSDGDLDRMRIEIGSLRERVAKLEAWRNGKH